MIYNFIQMFCEWFYTVGSLVLEEFHNPYSLHAFRLLWNVNSVLPRRVQTSLLLVQFQMEFHIEYI